MPCRRSCVSLLLLIFITMSVRPLRAVPPRPSPQITDNSGGPKIWLQESYSVPVHHVGGSNAVQMLAGGRATALAMAEGDFDADGVEDLVIGYTVGNGGVLAFHRGNLDAFAPQSEASFQAIGRGEFPSPFLPRATVVEVPVRPDFVSVGSFNGNGYPDVIVAARGGSSIYLLTNDGKGNFSAPKAIQVGGPVTALAAGDFGRQGVYSKLLVGISDHSGSYLMVYTGTPKGLGGLSVLPLRGPASNITFAHLGGIGPDAIFIAGGEVLILHSSSMQLEQLSLPVTAKALVVGSFIHDRNPQLQIAVLDSNGSVHIAAHAEFDPRAYSPAELQVLSRAARGRHKNPLTLAPTLPVNGWKIVETISGVAASSEQSPVLLRTHISDNGADDVMILNPLNRQMVVVEHRDSPAGATTFAPAELSFRPYNGSPVAALAMRTNVDGRPGIIAICQGQVDPLVMMPLPDPTFFPNRFDDPTPPSDLTTVCNNTSNSDTSSQCSLREALLKANATAGTDTIQVAAGTYTLTLPKVAGDYSGQHGALYVNDSVNIVGQVDGSGHPTSIIQAGTTAYNAGTANGVDMVMAVNEDINPITNATASLSNLILQNGHNLGTHGNDGDGGCMEFDTGSSGNANLTLTNVILQNCNTTQGEGGGIAIFNFIAPNSGQPTFVNSIFQNNSASDTSSTSTAATAGGIWVSQDSRMTMSNSQVLNNNATQLSSDGTAAGEGGGITITNNSLSSRQTVIHNSIISGNHASGSGGGFHNEANLLIDQSSIISNNSAARATVSMKRMAGEFGPTPRSMDVPLPARTLPP
jgi:hypothetical protein